MAVGGKMENVPAVVTRQNSEEIDKFLAGAASFADMMFGFMGESSESEENLVDFVDRDDNGNGDADEYEDEDVTQVEQNKAFWEAQEQLIQVNFV